MSLRSACQPDSPSSPAVLLAVINDPLGAVDDLGSQSQRPLINIILLFPQQDITAKGSYFTLYL